MSARVIQHQWNERTIPPGTLFELEYTIDGVTYHSGDRVRAFVRVHHETGPRWRPGDPETFQDDVHEGVVVTKLWLGHGRLDLVTDSGWSNSLDYFDRLEMISPYVPF